MIENNKARAVQRKFYNGGKPGLPRDFLEDIFNEERDNVRSALNEVRLADPKAYLRTMVEIAKLVVPKTGNIRVDHVNHDIDELRALGNSFDPIQLPEVSSPPYIEVAPWEEPKPAHPAVTDTQDEIMSSISSE